MGLGNASHEGNISQEVAHLLTGDEQMRLDLVVGDGRQITRRLTDEEVECITTHLDGSVEKKEYGLVLDQKYSSHPQNIVEKII